MWKLITIAAFVAALSPGIALGQTEGERSHFRVLLDGNQEVPPISTSGSGGLELHIAADRSSLDYELVYDDLVGDVAQAHLHFGRPGVNGGVMVFLCSNIGSPVPTPACPGPNAGEVSGTLDADDVIGPAAQGIAAGEFSEVLSALRTGTAYVNVHSTLYPTGEVRGDIP